MHDDVSVKDYSCFSNLLATAILGHKQVITIVFVSQNKP